MPSGGVDGNDAERRSQPSPRLIRVASAEIRCLAGNKYCGLRMINKKSAFRWGIHRHRHRYCHLKRRHHSLPSAMIGIVAALAAAVFTRPAEQGSAGRRSERAQKNKEFEYSAGRTCAQQIIELPRTTIRQTVYRYSVDNGRASAMPFHAAGIRTAAVQPRMHS